MKILHSAALLAGAFLIAACASGPRAASEATLSSEVVEAVASGDASTTEVGAAVAGNPDPGTSESPPAEGGAAAPEPAAVSAGPAASSRAPRGQEPRALLPSGFWADPVFQKRFRDSYLAETPVEPPVSFDERELLQEVMALMAVEDYDQALALLEDEQTQQSSAVFDQLRGNNLFLDERLEEATVAYQAAVDKYPKFLRAWKNLGIIHTQLGAHREAARALTQVIELGGGDSLIYGALGAAYLSLQNPVSAESGFRMAVLLDPEYVEWQLGLARSFFMQQRFAEAASLCGSLIADNPGRTDLWLLQANAFIGLEQPMKAAENYEFVERLGGSTESSMLLLADIYTNEELFDLAIAAYARGFELGTPPLVKRALPAVQLMIAREDYPAAKELIALAEGAAGETLELADEQRLLELLAMIAVSEGDDDGEATVLERLVSLDPTDGDALVQLGKFEQRGGNVERAELLFDRALVLPDHMGSASLAKAQLMVELERYSEAVSLLRDTLAVDDRQAVRDYLDSVQRMAGNR